MNLVRHSGAISYIGRSQSIQISGKRIKAFRTFSPSCQRPTDGVYRALTEMRVKTPWIDALNKKQKEGFDPTKPSSNPATPQDRDLSPKNMRDSHTSIVCSTYMYILKAEMRLTD